MTEKRKIRDGINLKHALSIILMSFCMWFLTGINFILFPSDRSNMINIEQSDYNPQGPVEEKSPENKSLTSIQEEYIHEHHNADLIWYNCMSLHKIHTVEKLQLIYPDILIPPPKV